MKPNNFGVDSAFQNYWVIDECGNRIWLTNGIIHRLDGPAVEYPSGNKEWWVNGKILSGPLKLLEHGANWKDLAEYLTPREIAKIKLDK